MHQRTIRTRVPAEPEREILSCVTDLQEPKRTLEGWVAASPEELADARRLFDAWNRGDVETWIEGFTPDCEWYGSTIGALEGGSTAIRGHEALRASLREFGEVWERFSVEIDDALRRGNLGLALGRVTARGRVSGVETDTPIFFLAELDEKGRIVWLKSLLDVDEALKAAAEREAGGGPA